MTIEETLAAMDNSTIYNNVNLNLNPNNETINLFPLPDVDKKYFPAHEENKEVPPPQPLKQESSPRLLSKA